MNSTAKEWAGLILWAAKNSATNLVMSLRASKARGKSFSMWPPINLQSGETTVPLEGRLSDRKVRIQGLPGPVRTLARNIAFSCHAHLRDFVLPESVSLRRVPGSKKMELMMEDRVSILLYQYRKRSASRWPSMSWSFVMYRKLRGSSRLKRVVCLQANMMRLVSIDFRRILSR